MEQYSTPEQIRITQLELELDSEKKKNEKLLEKIQKLQSANLNLQLQVEEEEELITNKLIKKLDRLKKEKEHIVQQVEQEEELLTNTLHKKLQTLKNEKMVIENQLEQDKKYIINRLQRQYDLVVAEKNNMERKIEQERSEALSQLRDTLNKIRSYSMQDVSAEENDLLESLSEQVVALQQLQDKFMKDKDNYMDKNEQLKKELNRLESENFLLEQKIRREKEKMELINTDNARAAYNLEMFSERKFNHVPSSHGGGDAHGRKRTRSYTGNNANRTRSTSMPPAAHIAPATKMQKQQEHSFTLALNGSVRSSPDISPRASPGRSAPVSPRMSPRLHISSLATGTPSSLPSRTSSYMYASSPLRNPYEDSTDQIKKLDLPSPTKMSPQHSPRTFQTKLKMSSMMSPRENTQPAASGGISQKLRENPV